MNANGDRMQPRAQTCFFCLRKSISFLLSLDNQCYWDAFPSEKGKRNIGGCMAQFLLQAVLAILDRISVPSILL